MSTTSQDVVMKYKDSSGNLTYLYPVTKKDNVTGLDDLDEHLVDTANPHNTTAAQVGAVVNSGVTTAGTGAAYTATVDGMTEFVTGYRFAIIPHVSSTSSSPTLNVNNLGAKYLRRNVSYMSGVTSTATANDWLAVGIPVTVEYNGSVWVVLDLPRPYATDIMGTVPITSGGTGATTAAAALTNLGAAASAHNHAATDITSGTLPISYGGTGATTASGARANLSGVTSTAIDTLATSYSTLMSSGYITASCTMAEAFEALPTNTMISWTHTTSSSVYITDMPANYGTVIMVKGNSMGYCFGLFLSYNGYTYVYKYSTSGTSSNGWKPVVTSLLPSDIYGSTFPSSPITGQLFFKKV